MIRKAVSSFLAISCLALSPAAFSQQHGGAIPKGLSFYETSEFADVQWASAQQGEPVWGSVILEGTEGKFVPDNGMESKFAYSEITAIKYERVVTKKDKAVANKWYQRPLAFARGVDTYRTVTIERKTSEGRKTSVMRVDELNALGIIQVLELKTGLKAKKLSSL
jgi:hypothetical protein